MSAHSQPTTSDAAPTLQEQIACVEREIAMRVRVYPHWIRGGRLKQDKADREIETMRAVLATLCGLVQS